MTHSIPFGGLGLPQLGADGVGVLHVDRFIAFSRTFTGDTGVVDPEADFSISTEMVNMN